MQLGDITEPTIEQSGPPRCGDFMYVDISSVDNKTKRIVDPKRLPIETAPSRARQRLMAGDVLVSMTRPNLNAVALVPPELHGAIGSTGFHVLRARDKVLPQWLYYGVQSRDFVTAMSALVQGALYPAVRPKDIRAFDIPLPDVDEQRRIVAEIEKQFSRVDEGVGNLKRVKANLKNYRAAVLKTAVEGQLVPSEAELARREGRSYEIADQLLLRIHQTRRRQWRNKAKYKEPLGPNITDLPELPKGWAWATVKQLGAVGEQAVLTGPFGSNMGRSDFQDTGVPVLTIGCLQEDGLSLEKAVFVSDPKAEELARYRLRRGDVLFSRMASVGRAGFVTKQFDGALFNYHIMRLRLEETVIEPMYFICYVQGAKSVRDYVREVNHGATRDGINTEQLLSLPVALPPLDEQKRIVEEVERRVSLIQESDSQVDTNLSRAKRLRETILERAFFGQLHQLREVS